jgi:hypothetical protein
LGSPVGDDFESVALDGARFSETLYTWMTIGIKMEVGFLVDGLTAMMMCVVTFVSLMVHIYTGYMEERGRLQPVLRIHLAVHIRHADAEQQHAAAVFSAGAWDSILLPVDWFYFGNSISYNEGVS